MSARLLAEERYQLPFLLLFLVLLHFPFLGGRDLWAPVEPRYGEIARVMFEHGEWIVPRVNGEVYADKPILFFWAVLLASYVAGGVTEWTVRFPSAVAACGVTLITYAFGKRCSGGTVGFLAALIVATTALSLWEARWAHTDMLFTLFLAASLFFLLRIWLGEAERKNVGWAFAFMGLATLTKGMIGFALPGFVFLALVVWTGEWGKLRALNLPFGVAVFVVVTAPWFAAVSLRTDGAWLTEFIWRHHVQRYLSGPGHEEAFYYYLINFPINFLPWTFFLALAVWGYWPLRKEPKTPAAWFCASWLGMVFLFFSLSTTKRTLYLLPIFPPAALLTAHYVWEVARERGPGFRGVKAVMIFIGAVFILAGFALPVIAWKALPTEVIGLLPMAAVLVASGGIVFRSLRSGRCFSAVVALAAVMGLSFVSAQRAIIPLIDREKSPRPFADKIKRHVAPGDPLYIYRDTMHDLNFYLAREVIPIVPTPAKALDLGRETRGAYLLTRDGWFVRNVVKTGTSWRIVARQTVGGKEWLLLRAGAETWADQPRL